MFLPFPAQSGVKGNKISISLQVVSKINMNREHIRHIISRLPAVIMAAVACMSVSCIKEQTCRQPTMPEEIDNVLIVYMAGKANGLASAMKNNMSDFCDGYVPEGYDSNILLAYEELTSSSSPTRSYLTRIYRHCGSLVRDTLVTYPVNSIGATAETLEDVLNEARSRFPAKSYGLLVSSHGTGWLPKGFYSDPDSYEDSMGGGTEMARRLTDTEEWVPYVEKWQDPSLPAVKSICQDLATAGGQTVSYEMNIQEFAGAIPYHLDYIIFDCCLMGGIEVAYELKDVCDRIIFSPSEVLTLGFNYDTMGRHLLGGSEPDLEGVARDYYNKYAAMSGDYQSATVTLVDCSRMEPLAEACRLIFSNCREQLDALDGTGIQEYFRYGDPVWNGDHWFYDHWFYDLRDIAANAGASDFELDLLDATLDNCIIYKAATEEFLGIRIERYSGLSMYLPGNGSPYLDSFYRDLAWDAATGLVSGMTEK